MSEPINCSPSELSTYLRALGEGYLATYCLDTAPSAQSKSISIASKSFRKGKKTGCFHGFPSLTMSRLSTASRGADLSIASAAGSRVKTLAAPEKDSASKREPGQGFGRRWHVSFAKYNPATASWKIPQCLLGAGWDEYVETWPEWGIMQDGGCWGLTPPDLSTTEPEFGWLPTPIRSDAHNVQLNEKRFQGLSEWVAKRCVDAVTAGEKQNPQWWEWVMCWPIGWTALKPLEMDRFRQWLNLHGKC